MRKNFAQPSPIHTQSHHTLLSYLQQFAHRRDAFDGGKRRARERAIAVGRRRRDGDLREERRHCGVVRLVETERRLAHHTARCQAR